MSGHPHTPQHQDVSQQEVLQVLYPWYKEEVFRRREHMVRLTAFSCAFLVLLLVGFLFIPASFSADQLHMIFALLGVILFSGLFGYFILQQRARHIMAKQTLIEIERALGLYEEGFYLEESTLYPIQWQSDWTKDWSILIYLTVLGTLTLLVLTALLLR